MSSVPNGSGAGGQAGLQPAPARGAAWPGAAGETGLSGRGAAGRAARPGSGRAGLARGMERALER